MNFKSIKIIPVFLCIFALNGCVFSTFGDSLGAFSARLNNLQENYTISAENYIIDTEKETLTKFFKFDQNELMLQFKYDHKNRLNEMNIAFDFAAGEGTEELQFIKDLLTAFCQNEETATQLMDATDFEKAIKTISNKTTSAESENIRIEIDTTQLGTIISVYKDI